MDGILKVDGMLRRGGIQDGVMQVEIIERTAVRKYQTQIHVYAVLTHRYTSSIMINSVDDQLHILQVQDIHILGYL